MKLRDCIRRRLALALRLTLSAAIGLACPVLADNDAVWEREQQQRRVLREAAVSAARETPSRIDVLRTAIADADEHDEDQAAIRYATMMHAEAGAGTRERAEAAIVLAYALEAPDDAYKAREQVAALRREAELNLRRRLARRGDREDALLLGGLLEHHASRLDAAQHLRAIRGLVALYRAHLPAADEVLLRVRRKLALALHRAGQSDAAEAELRAVTVALASPVRAPGPQFMHELAWLLIERGKHAAAASYIAQSFTGIDGAANSALARDTHALRWMIARSQGDWPAAKAHAAAFRGKLPVDADPHAALMTLEAERALGNVAAAQRLATALASASQAVSAAARRCVMRPTAALWQGAFENALLAIERRELRCVPG